MFRWSLIKNTFKNREIKRLFIRYQSSSVQEKSRHDEGKLAEDQVRNDEKVNIKISTKIDKKLPSRQPLLKNIFIGKVDNDMMPFPEVIEREDLSKLQKDLEQTRDILKNLITTNVEVSQGKGSQIKDELKRLALYGHNIPHNYGGSAYLCTESLLAAESTMITTDISNILSSHHVVNDVLLKFGTDYQKERFLPKMASGSTIATDAIYESEHLENEFFSTTATYDDIDKNWIINGEKSFVLNGKTAGLFLVVAQTNKLDIAGNMTPGVIVFLVEASTPGITRNKELITLGCKDSEYGIINFKNVVIPESLVLGVANEGNDIAQHIIQFQRFRKSLINLSLTKNLINDLTKFCIKEKQSEVFLRDMEGVRDQLSKLVCKAYSLESMLYYTSALVDEFDNQDVSLEVAVTKLHSLNILWDTVCTSIHVMGPSSLISGCPTELALRNSAQLSIQGESKNSLCLYIGLLGLQHAGINTYETIDKERNPLFHPGYIIGKLFKQESIDKPTMKWKLNEELHPTLQIPSESLELSIARMQMSTQTLLTRYGTEVIEKHVEINRMAEMALLIYSMFTCLSRSSRSYCIGLKHSDYEILLATTICNDAADRVKALSTEIEVGPYINNDRNHSKIAKQIFKSHGYFSENPITYNF